MMRWKKGGGLVNINWFNLGTLNHLVCDLLVIGLISTSSSLIGEESLRCSQNICPIQALIELLFLVFNATLTIFQLYRQVGCFLNKTDSHDITEIVLKVG